MADDVRKQSDAVAKMAEDWALIDALMGGTSAMRQTGKTYLPQWPAEDPDAYRAAPRDRNAVPGLRPDRVGHDRQAVLRSRLRSATTSSSTFHGARRKTSIFKTATCMPSLPMWLPRPSPSASAASWWTARSAQAPRRSPTNRRPA